MFRTAIFIILTITGTALVTPIYAAPIPASFDSAGTDRTAIERLLAEYATAVSNKDEPRFEALLLNKAIQFSDVGSAISAKGAVSGTENYESFRKGVFQGPAFQQRFQNVSILQDGPLAEVSLVFVNSDAKGSTWGWKTMQLLKIDGQWKIASEFFTGHA